MPKTIVASKPLKYQVGTRQASGLGDETIKFDWLSFNSDDLDTRLFDGTFVRNFESDIALILPGTTIQKPNKEELIKNRNLRFHSRSKKQSEE